MTGDVRKGESQCHQMIMGAGKTTVVGPLLALMLGDAKMLVMQGTTTTVSSRIEMRLTVPPLVPSQVVPHALLEMSRARKDRLHFRV